MVKQLFMVDLVFCFARWAVCCLAHFFPTAPPSNIHLYYYDNWGIHRVRVRITEYRYYRRTHNVVRIDCSYFFPFNNFTRLYRG